MFLAIIKDVQGLVEMFLLYFFYGFLQWFLKKFFLGFLQECMLIFLQKVLLWFLHWFVFPFSKISPRVPNRIFRTRSRISHGIPLGNSAEIRPKSSPLMPLRFLQRLFQEFLLKLCHEFLLTFFLVPIISRNLLKKFFLWFLYGFLRWFHRELLLEYLKKILDGIPQGSLARIPLAIIDRIPPTISIGIPSGIFSLKSNSTVFLNIEGAFDIVPFDAILETTRSHGFVCWGLKIIYTTVGRPRPRPQLLFCQDLWRSCVSCAKGWSKNDSIKIEPSPKDVLNAMSGSWRSPIWKFILNKEPFLTFLQLPPDKLTQSGLCLKWSYNCL